MLHMVVEQTYKYPMRMIYDPESNTFTAGPHFSMAYKRNFTNPYGWIKESGTPPKEHWDCILMTERDYELGDEVEIKVIGMFKRKDMDHKYIVVESSRPVEDYSELSDEEKEELRRLYPRIDEGEGWFGKHEAEECMKNDPMAL